MAATPAPSRRRTPCATARSRRAAEADGEGPYALVVVGAGISGLAAAHFFREARPGAAVLILDNHDDFGGHARRNEFRGDGGRLMLMNGGTMSIDSPRPYGAAADGLLRALGVRPAELEARCSDRGFYAGRAAGAVSSSTARPSAPTTWPPASGSAPGAKCCVARR